MFDLKGAFNSGIFEAYTCLMCVEGGKDNGGIIGCIKWGFDAVKRRRNEAGKGSFPTGSIIVNLSDPELTCGIPDEVKSAVTNWNESEEHKVKVGPNLNDVK